MFFEYLGTLRISSSIVLSVRESCVIGKRSSHYSFLAAENAIKTCGITS